MRHPVCKVSFPNYDLLAGKLLIASIPAAGVGGSVPHGNTFVLFGFRVCKVWAIQSGAVFIQACSSHRHVAR